MQSPPSSSAPSERPRGTPPAVILALVNEVIVDEQRDDAVYLWLLREHALQAPNYGLADLVDLDSRLAANLDAVALAGQRGLAMAREAAESPVAGPGDVFVLAALAASLEEPGCFESALALASEPEAARAVIAAMSWLPFAVVSGQARLLSESSDPLLARLGLAASANHRRDLLGPRLAYLAYAADERLRARALRAIGELGRTDLISVLQQALRLPDARSQMSACWSLLRLGQHEPDVLRLLWSWIERDDERAPVAAELAGRTLGHRSGLAWYHTLRASPPHHRSAIVLASHLGDSVVVEDLIAWISVPHLARSAGAALSMIIGLDIEYEDLDGEPPEGFAAGPSEDPDDEDTDLDPDEDVPWPNPEAISAWWLERGASYPAGVRLLAGQPISTATCHRALVLDRQPVRAAAALELGRGRPGEPYFPLRAPAARQRRHLGLSGR